MAQTKLALLPPRPEVTPGDVRAFFDWYCKRMGIRLVRKQSAPEMQVLGELLDALGVIDKDVFLERFTTVVPPLGAVYIPFEPGVPREGYDLWNQIVVLCHEGEHMLQCRADGDLTFGWKYVVETAARAHYEALAYRVNLELHFRFYGTIPYPTALASRLDYYGCTTLDVQVAAKELWLAVPTVKAGAIVQHSTRIACEWLDRRWPQRPALPLRTVPRKPPTGLPRLSTTTRTPLRTRRPTKRRKGR